MGAPVPASVTTPVIADGAPDGLGEGEGDGLTEGEGLGDGDGPGDGLGDGLGDGAGDGDGEGEGGGGALRAVTLTLSTSSTYRLMTSIAPWEKVESVAEAILVPLMKAESELPTTSISSVYHVEEL